MPFSPSAAVLITSFCLPASLLRLPPTAFRLTSSPRRQLECGAPEHNSGAGTESDPGVNRERKTMRITTIAAIAMIALALAACGQSESKTPPAAPPAPQVTVAKPVTRQITDHDEYVGRFVAVDSVEVRARVSGYLEEIHFRDGQMVQAGRSPVHHRQAAVPERAGAGAGQSRAGQGQSRLYRSRPEARAEQLGARPHHHRADLRPAHAGQPRRAGERSRRRRRRCARPSSISSSPNCARRSTAASATAACRAGNLVTGGTAGTTTLLATIVSLDPIRFEFTLDEASYLRYERFASSGKEVDRPRRRAVSCGSS